VDFSENIGYFYFNIWSHWPISRRQFDNLDLQLTYQKISLNFFQCNKQSFSVTKHQLPVCLQCDLKKSPNVYKSCPKMISLEKLPKNVGDLGKLILAKGFKKLPKVQ